MSDVRVRFAPSPTGFLHVGGARTALFNWLWAKHEGGTLLLRIEDTDVGRSSQEMVEGILAGLRWLGIDWDEGPYFQSQRLSLYRTAAQSLLEARKAYRCFCSIETLNAKREVASKAKQAWKYEGTCRTLTDEEIQANEKAGLTGVVRFKVPAERKVDFHDQVFGHIEPPIESLEDFVLLRSDGMPTYHLSVVVDDIDMRISHVIRGADHLSNTPKQILLYQALNSPLPLFVQVG